jgi:hypothetical protein
VGHRAAHRLSTIRPVSVPQPADALGRALAYGGRRVESGQIGEAAVIEGETARDSVDDAALLRAHVKPLPENLDRSRKMGVITMDPLEIVKQRSAVAAALGTLNADQRAALVDS